MKLLLIAVFIFTAGAGFLVLREASSAGAHRTTESILSNGIAAESTVQPLGQSESTDTRISATALPNEDPKEPLQDVKSILENRCQACHMVKSLLGMAKTRTQWEISLTKMAGFGVELSENEKSILLDTLAVPE